MIVASNNQQRITFILIINDMVASTGACSSVNIRL